MNSSKLDHISFSIPSPMSYSYRLNKLMQLKSGLERQEIYLLNVEVFFMGKVYACPTYSILRQPYDMNIILVSLAIFKYNHYGSRDLFSSLYVRTKSFGILMDIAFFWKNINVVFCRLSQKVRQNATFDDANVFFYLAKNTLHTIYDVVVRMLASFL